MGESGAERVVATRFEHAPDPFARGPNRACARACTPERALGATYRAPGGRADRAMRRAQPAMRNRLLRRAVWPWMLSDRRHGNSAAGALRSQRP